MLVLTLSDLELAPYDLLQIKLVSLDLWLASLELWLAHHVSTVRKKDLSLGKSGQARDNIF